MNTDTHAIGTADSRTPLCVANHATNRRCARLTAVLLAAAFMPLSAMSDENESGKIEVFQPYAQPTPPGVTRGAGYLELINHGDKDDRLTGGRVHFAHELQIHETTVEGEISRMRELTEGLLIPAGEAVRLEPMGKHVMFIDLVEPLVEGTRQKGVLSFEHAGDIEVEFSIEYTDTEAMNPDAMKHGSMGGGSIDHGTMDDSEKGDAKAGDEGPDS